MRLARTRTGKRVVMIGSGALALALAGLAGRHFAAAGWPLSHGHPGLLVAAGFLFLLAYAFKAHGWRRLFAAGERPHSLALAAANGGASLMGLALPGRFDDVIRIAILRRYPGCRAGVRTLCLSLFMLGLIDSAALAPLAFAGVVPSHTTGVRVGLAVVAAAGIAAAGLIFVLPRVAGSARLLRIRLGRWLKPRTTPLREASQAWAFVSASWLARAVALFLLLGTLGVGFSFPLAIVFLCAGAASALVPIGPAGAATQAGAGAAILMLSGVGASQAIGFAVAVQALVILAGAGIVVFALLWHIGVRLRLTSRLTIRPVQSAT